MIQESQGVFRFEPEGISEQKGNERFGEQVGDFMKTISNLVNTFNELCLKFKKWAYTSDVLLKSDSLKPKIDALKYHQDKFRMASNPASIIPEK